MGHFRNTIRRLILFVKWYKKGYRPLLVWVKSYEK